MGRKRGHVDLWAGSTGWASLCMQAVLVWLLCGIAPFSLSPGSPESIGRIPYDEGPIQLGTHPFSLSGRKWEKLDLTYGSINTTPDLGPTVTRAAIEEAFALWAAVTPLTFTEMADCGLAFNAAACDEPDIRLLFGQAGHGDAFPFNGTSGGVLAHAFFLRQMGGRLPVTCTLPMMSIGRIPCRLSALI